MATTVERLSIVETKVANLNEKMDDLKVDVKDMHNCLDITREEIKEELEKMYKASCDQHSVMAKEIGTLKSWRDKWVWTAAGVVAAMGWASGHADVLTKIF